MTDLRAADADPGAAKESVSPKPPRTVWQEKPALIIGALAICAALIVGFVATSGNSAGQGTAAQYCQLAVTWPSGGTMTIAEALDAASASSCGDLASELTQGAQGYFTVASDGSLSSMPTGICTVDGVTLVSTPQVPTVACAGLSQDINYLTP